MLFLSETGETGKLVPYLDHRAMADAIERLLDNPAYARAMGANLRRRALDLLDRASAQRFQRSTYQELLSC